MVYLFGALGLVIGFFMGLWVINVLLRNVSKSDLQTNKSIWRVYGLLVWLFAGLGSWLAVFVYETYFSANL